MLPGDPLRVFTLKGPESLGATSPLHASPGETAPTMTDPTAMRAQEVNPFTGEGL